MDDADIEVEIQRELEEEEEATKSAFKLNMEQQLTKVKDSKSLFLIHECAIL